MAHFTHFYFSLGLKSFISAIFNFRWASNLSFRPFSIFVGLKIAHFSRFQFSLELSRLVSAIFQSQNYEK